MDILGFILTLVKTVASRSSSCSSSIAYILLADRKIWAAVQMRKGPNVVGPWGLFQSFADLIKFVLKEPIIPAGANKGVFLLAPFVMGCWRCRPGRSFPSRTAGRSPTSTSARSTSSRSRRCRSMA